MPLSNDVLDEFPVVQSLRQHEIISNAFLMLVVLRILEVVPLLAVEVLALAVVYEVSAVLELIRQNLDLVVLLQALVLGVELPQLLFRHEI